MKRALLVLVFAIIITVLTSVSVGTAAFALSDYELGSDAFEKLGGKQYNNAEEGSSYYVKINENAYKYLVRAEYEKIRLASIADTVLVDAENNVTLASGQLRLGKTTLQKSDFTKKNNSSLYCCTVSTDVNCAFVFTFYYDDGSGEAAVYGTEFGSEGKNRNNVFYCRTIDDSAPTAYAEFSHNENGMWVFNVTVRSNFISDVHSANSGLSKFTVRQIKNGASVQYGEEVKNIGATAYVHELKVPNIAAEYRYDIVDNAGNASSVTVWKNRETRDDHIVALDNYLARLKEDYYSDFSEAITEKLKKGRDSYYVALQNGTDEERAQIKANNVKLMAKIAEYEELKDEGNIDVAVKNYNTDYFGGEIMLLKTASLPLKFGDGAEATIAVGQYSFDKTDKGFASAAGISGAGECYLVTLETRLGGELVEERLATPMTVRLPTELNKGDKIVLRSGEEYETLDFVVGSGYTDVYVRASSGTLAVFISPEKRDLTYLWFLAVIPVAAAAVAIIIVKKKKRKIK